MLFGISTVVFFIFILVSYFRSEHACLCEIFHENRKIKFGLYSSCLTFMIRDGKKINKETEKSQYNSLTVKLKKP